MNPPLGLHLACFVAGKLYSWNCASLNFLNLSCMCMVSEKQNIFSSRLFISSKIFFIFNTSYVVK